MRNLTMIKSLFLGLLVFTSFVHADNSRQTVTKELLSSTLSGGMTTLDWVVRYESNSSTPLNDVVITDNFSSAQTYVPTTEAHPNGWSVTQGPNQFVWEIGSGDGYTRDFPSIPEDDGEIVTSGTGDGYSPIPYTALNGDKRVYVINHHMNQSFLSFNCIGNCSGGAWPRNLPDGDSSSSKTSSTTGGSETIIYNRKLYYAVTRSTDSGIGCYDLESNSECGYLQLSTLSNSSMAVMDGPFKVGSNAILIDGNMQVYKVDISGNSMSLLNTLGLTGLNNQTTRAHVGGVVIGTKVYMAIGEYNNKVTCIDTLGSLSQCWSTPSNLTFRPANTVGPELYIHYSPSMVPEALCSRTSSLQCLDINSGSSVVKMDIFTSCNNGQGIGKGFTFSNKTCLPCVFGKTIYCHDWVSSSTSAIISPNTNSRMYATEVDDNGCAWAYGDRRILWNYDVETSVQPCNSDNNTSVFLIEDTYDASDNWCATKDAEWSYTQFEINGLRPGMFTDLNITFYDASGNVIKVANLPVNSVSFSQGLFTAPFVAGEPIHYKIEGTRNPNANPDWAVPVITIGVDGPPREFCFQTTVPCPVTGDITNHVEVQLKGEHPVDSSADVVEDAQGLCKEVLPEPKQCLNAEPTLKCTKTGWAIELDTFTPSTFNASNTDMQVLAPLGATVTKWGNTWHVNGVSAGDTLNLSMQGVQVGAGKLEGGDLCCDGESNITIPDEETCEVEDPHIYVRKSYDELEGVFDLKVRIMNTIYAPQVLTVTDTLPAGITITGIDPRSSSEWMCTNAFPVVGPASINCVYIGAMPVTGVKDLYLTSTVDNSQMPAENCADSGVVGTDGVSVWTSPMAHHCITIDKEDNDTIPPDNNDTNTTCGENEILIDGVCEQLPENPCPSGQQMVDGYCIEMPEINCQSNIILVVDKSDSIRAAGGQNGVKAMMQSFLDRFRGNGSQAAIVYFDTTASIVRPMSTITVGDIAPGYNPTVGGLTNWEDALEKTRSIVSAGDIVFFITDGQPNRYLNVGGNVVPTGVPPATNTPALTTLENLATLEASVVANQIKSLGAKIVSVGVGSIGSSVSAIQHLNDIASTPSDININAFDELEGMANDYASNACPDLLLTKKFIGGFDGGNGCRRVRIINENQTGTFEIKVQNTTSTPLSGIVVRDVLPTRLTLPSNFITSNGTASSTGNIITWNVGALPASGVETLRFDVSLPAITTNYEKIYNYAEVTNATGVDITPLLANSQNGPLNINEHDEAVACVQIYEYTPPPACDPATDTNHCLSVYKRKLSGEGNCLAGGECRYSISIRNRATVPYTSTLNITDAMTPSGATSSITITPQGSAPNPLCSPTPTSVPFSCTQTADIPANTTWYYNVVMSSTPQDAQKNTFIVNNVSFWFNFPSSNKQSIQEHNDTGCQTDKDCKAKEYCSEEDGLCLPKEHADEPAIHLPVVNVPVIDIPVVKPKPSKAHITLRKRAPKECKAGQKCTFRLTLTNKGKKTYKGPLNITDRSKEFVGKLVGTSPSGWRCKTTRKGYVCANPKVTLGAGESTTVKLTVRIPQRAKGYLNNCAKLDFPRGKVKVMALQSMLLSHGFDPNGIDGGMGKGTKKALKAYMKSKGMKSQKSTIKKLVESYPHVTSKNSCVKVKIKKSKIKCKKYEKLVGEKCKPRCKKWQHWDGKHCVTCPKGTKWSKKYKECKETRRPHVNVSVKPKGKKCPKGYVKFGRHCEKISDKEIVEKKCGFLTRLNHRTGRCEPIINISIGIGGGGGGDKDKPRKEHDRGPVGY